MSEEELQREIVSGAFSMQVADCERNIRIQFEKLQQENAQLKNAIKRCYTPEEIDFEIMSVKAELQAEKDINNNLHKTIDKLRVNLYETQQENQQLKDRINNAIEYIGSREMYNDDFDTETNKLLNLLKGENNE